MEKKKALVNILMSIFSCGILDELKTMNSVSSIDFGRFTSKLADDFGYSEDLSKQCLDEWIRFLGKEIQKEFVRLISDDEFKFGENNELLKNKGSKANVVIPDGVTSIGASVFDGCYPLKSIEIPDSVTSIGDSAFEECDNLTVYISDNTIVENYCVKNRISYEKEE